MNKDSSDSDKGSLEGSLSMFTPYNTVEAIPRAVFRRARAIIDPQNIQTDAAAIVIAKAILDDWNERLVPLEKGKSQEQVLEMTREKIELRLKEVPRPSQPGLDQSAIRLIHPVDLRPELRKTS